MNQRRPDASMTLLTELFDHPLDPGYAAASEARTRRGGPAARPVRAPVVAVAAVCIGLLFTVGARTLGSDRVADGKRALIDQITTREAEVEARTQTALNLQSEVSALEGEAATQAGSSAARLDRLRLAAGATAVTGPGIVVTLDDAPSVTPDDGGDSRGATGGTPEGTVLSRDLQIVTNGLWQAGAEAIAINGRRLTSRSSIRFAGEAILVDYRPLSPPYVVSAIGDPDALRTGFAANDGGAYLAALENNYGVRGSIEPSDEIRLPAAVSLSTRVSKPAPTSSTESPS